LLGELSQAQKRLKVSLFLTFGLVVIEVVGGVESNSISLVSDAAHVFTDAMAISLSLFAVILASRHHMGSMTFGYHRAEVLAALANGVALSAISVWVLFEASQRILFPRHIDAPLMLVIAIVGLAGNLLIMLLLKPHSRKSINIRSAFVHVIYDAVSSVAVIISALVVFFAGVTIGDSLVAFIIAGLIARSAYSIVRDSTRILLEGAPQEMEVKDIINSLKQVNGVVDVHDLHVWTISSGMHALSGHVVVHDQMVSQSSQLVQRINELLSEKFKIDHTTIQIEDEREISFKRTTNYQKK